MATASATGSASPARPAAPSCRSSGSSSSRAASTSVGSAMRRCRSRPRGGSSTSRRAGCRSRSSRTTAARSGALKKRVEHVVGSGANVQTPGEVSDQICEQLAGLNIVLYFFSGVALFVGGFLILNSFNMTVLQRMRELGMLRTLGASRRMAMSVGSDRGARPRASSAPCSGLALGLRPRVRADLADARHGRARSGRSTSAPAPRSPPLSSASS